MRVVVVRWNLDEVSFVLSDGCLAGSGGSGYRKFQKINLDIHGQESNFLYPLKIDDLNSTFPSGMPSFQGLC